eukprot:GHRR01031596.1.p1 GENE.GHRR01031596.1~~GHRR01031596.1.p1  ORF type:complete len:171 (+),score=28.33 GHRR01031596.1:65-514(+)
MPLTQQDGSATECNQTEHDTAINDLQRLIVATPTSYSLSNLCEYRSHTHACSRSYTHHNIQDVCQAAPLQDINTDMPPPPNLQHSLLGTCRRQDTQQSHCRRQSTQRNGCSKYSHDRQTSVLQGTIGATTHNSVASALIAPIHVCTQIH